MINYYDLNRDDLKIEVERINNEWSEFYRGSHVKITHIPTGEWIQMYGQINVSQIRLLQNCIDELADILKYPSKSKIN